MPHASAAGIDLCYETFGSPQDPALLLIMGLGCQLIHWDEALCEALARRGFWVIRFDNRDIGLSTKLHHHGLPPLARLMVRNRVGLPVSAPYSLEDMSDDTFHLLDALGVQRAHVVGASMGGMIAQVMALRHPERVLSLCSWMSTTGDPRVSRPTSRALRALMKTPPTDADALMDHAVDVWRVLGSKGALFNEARVRRVSRAAYLRSNYRRGFARQMAAVLAASPRNADLARVRAPTLVMHGRIDPLIPMAAAQATAAAIPGAELVLFDDTGHDIPEPLWPRFIAAIETNTRR